MPWPAPQQPGLVAHVDDLAVLFMWEGLLASLARSWWGDGRSQGHPNRPDAREIEPISHDDKNTDFSNF